MTIRDRIGKALGSGRTALKKWVADSSQQPTRRPRPGQIISGARYDYMPESGKHALDPAKLGNTLRAADTGDTRAMFEMFSAVEEDPHVISVLSKRRRAVTSRTLSITAEPTANGQSAIAQRAADVCNELVFGTAGSGGIDDLPGVLYDATDAIGRGYSLQQIVWKNELGRARPVRLERWPQRDTVLGSVFDPYAQDCDTVRIVTDQRNWQGEDLEPNQWVLHIAKARSEILARAALLRTVCWWYLFKRFSVADWAIFGERYGMPLRVGHFPVGADDSERAALKAAVIDLGKDTGAIIPEGSKIEFVEAKISGQLPYERLLQVCNTEISKAILGNTLTTEVGSTGGNRALGEVHERAELDLVEADASSLANTLRGQLIRPMVAFNVGPTAPLPKVDFLSEEERAQKDRAERDQILVRGIGLPIAKSYFYQSYEVPVPKDGEELVNPPQEHKTATEDLGDEQNAEVERAADEADLCALDRDAVRVLANLRGTQYALEHIRTLAGSKKKSRAWAL